MRYRLSRDNFITLSDLLSLGTHGTGNLKSLFRDRY